ncbi:MAG: UDP-N-acetylmuramate--L-alanine ligase [Acidobacteriota bacterium]
MIRFSRVKKIHFVGVGGSGMSGIAEVLNNMGFVVTGSDISESATINSLRKTGVKVFLGHKKENVKGIETLVYSSAIKKDNIEVLEALKMKIPVIPRAEMLAELMRVKYSLAIAGTHGKTTTTSMVACILNTAKKDPTYVVGGKLKTEESGAKLGSSNYLIAEADESDGSFLKLFPTIAVITNIEDDHLDYYGSLDKLIEAFIDFGNKVPFYGSVIINKDCDISRKIISNINKRVVTFGLAPDADIVASDIKSTTFRSSFELSVYGSEKGRVELNIGGLHNISNALSAIAASIESGIEIDIIKEGLQRFSLPDRRFQVLYKSDNILVVDDYAHHPTEVKATIDTLKRGSFKRIFGVFQPHRYTRLQILMDQFAESFSGLDSLVLAKLYAANQEEIEEINSKALTEKIKKSGLSNVINIDDFDDIISYLGRKLKDGDAVVFLSAGDLTNVAHRFGKKMEEEER